MSAQLSELKRALLGDIDAGVRLRHSSGAMLAPRVRMVTPEGDYAVAIEVPNEAEGRDAIFAALKCLFRWKQAFEFTMVSELQAQEALVGVAVRYNEFACAIAPLSISKLADPKLLTENGVAVTWVAPEKVGSDIRALLPRGRAVLTAADIAILEELFGTSGRFPLVHVRTNEVRGPQTDVAHQ